MALHEAGREREGEGLQASDILLYSRYYRSALHECVLGLKQQEKSGSGERQSEVFSAMALVWHLVEILFIEVRVCASTCHSILYLSLPLSLPLTLPLTVCV